MRNEMNTRSLDHWNNDTRVAIRLPLPSLCERMRVFYIGAHKRNIPRELS